MGGDLADVQLKTTVAAGVDIVAMDAWGRNCWGIGRPTSPRSSRRAEYKLGTMNYPLAGVAGDRRLMSGRRRTWPACAQPHGRSNCPPGAVRLVVHRGAAHAGAGLNPALRLFFRARSAADDRHVADGPRRARGNAPVAGRGRGDDPLRARLLRLDLPPGDDPCGRRLDRRSRLARPQAPRPLVALAADEVLSPGRLPRDGRLRRPLGLRLRPHGVALPQHDRGRAARGAMGRR